MRSVGILLSLVCGLSAMPLRLGASWTWEKVWRTRSGVSWINAKVIGSIAHDSGTLWYLKATDSLRQEFDTATILEFRDGRQKWIKGSVYFPWEPKPWDGWTGVWRRSTAVGDPAITAPWGTWMEYPFWHDTGVVVMAPSAEWPFPTIEYQIGQVATAEDLPPGLWDDSLGFVRGRFNGSILIDWWLVAKDGVRLETIPGKVSLSVPLAGAVREWTERRHVKTERVLTEVLSETDTVLAVRWEVLGRQVDSAGWARARVRVTRKPWPHYDSLLEYELRLNPGTTERVPNRGWLCPELDEGWWRFWLDSTVQGGFTRHEMTESKSIAPMHTRSRFFTHLRAEGEVDSQYCQTLEMPNTGIQTTTTIIRTLRSVVDPAVATKSVKQGPRSLRALALTYPETPVRWTDARGRSGRATLAELRDGSFHAGGGIVWIDATMPDGTRLRETRIGGI